MGAADLLQGHGRSGGVAPAPAPRGAAAPDYHALGTFSETWAFLELFVDRCARLVGGVGGEQEPGLRTRLEALDAAVRVAPALRDLAGETTALTAEVRTLARRRQAALQDMARASLDRLGMNLFEIPGHAQRPNAVPSPFGDDIETLHLTACELVRRTLLLLGALETRVGGRA